MHVAPPDLRALRQRGLVLRFAALGSIAFVLAETSKAGSDGTTMEQPSRLPHWGLVIEGELSFESDDGSVAVPAGHAFHVPANGLDHHFRASGAIRVAGFQPLDPATD